MNNQTSKIVRAMRSSKGRFFGLTTKQGNTINGRFVSETPNYVRVYDRNRGVSVKLAKASLATFNQGEDVIL